MAKLRVDFYESGKGDTIVITFPSGGVGLVDASPSTSRSRLGINEILRGKSLEFVCLSHPHLDHLEDLVPVVESHPDIKEVWITVSDVAGYLSALENTPNFLSDVGPYAEQLSSELCNLYIDFFGKIVERGIKYRNINSGIRDISIDGVEVSCLGPDESIQNDFFNAYCDRLKNPSRSLPNVNSISAILTLRYGESVVLLGGDALKPNWRSAVEHHRRRSIPKAHLLKVPHHGAKNALDLRHKEANYLDACSTVPKVKAVLFAGDSRHPDSDVFTRLKGKTDLVCVSNGLMGHAGAANPLRLMIPGAQAVRDAAVCNPVVSFELDDRGLVTLVSGSVCGYCSS